MKTRQRQCCHLFTQFVVKHWRFVLPSCQFFSWVFQKFFQSLQSQTFIRKFSNKLLCSIALKMYTFSIKIRSLLLKPNPMFTWKSRLLPSIARSVSDELETKLTKEAGPINHYMYGVSNDTYNWRKQLLSQYHHWKKLTEMRH